MNTVQPVVSPIEAIENLIACTAARPQGKDQTSDLVNKIGIFLNSAGNGHVALDFLKGRLRTIQSQILQGRADLIGKVRAVANLTFMLLHPEGKDHPHIAREKQEFLRGMPDPNKVAIVLTHWIGINAAGLIRDLCWKGLVPFLPPQTAMELWTWASVHFETEVLSAILSAFWIDPQLTGAVVAKAFAQGRFAEIAESVICYHFGVLAPPLQEQVARWVYEIDKVEARAPMAQRVENLLAAVGQIKNDPPSLLRQFVAGGELLKIETMLQEDAVTEMDSRQFQKILTAALARDKPDSLSLLVQHPSFDNFDRNFLFKALLSLIQKQRFDMVKILMSTTSFSRLPVLAYPTLLTLLSNAKQDDLVQLVQKRLELRSKNY